MTRGTHFLPQAAFLSRAASVWWLKRFEDYEL